MSESKYYWLKLHEGFFDEKNTIYLRSLPGGDELVIIYLKMQLKSLRTEGFIKYDGLLPTCEEELAMVLNEDAKSTKLCIDALERLGAVERWDGDMLYMASLQPLIGSEGESAQRVRKHREKKKQLSLQCNSDVTKCNTEIEIDIEKDIDIDKESDIKDISLTRYTEKLDYNRIISAYQNTCVSLPQLKSFSDARKKSIEKIFSEKGYTYEDLERAFKKVNESSFLKGESDNGWKASFDWIIKPSNLSKILEGNYDDKVEMTADELKEKNRENVDAFLKELHRND